MDAKEDLLREAKGLESIPLCVGNILGLETSVLGRCSLGSAKLLLFCG
jgi:hypothetical protein